MSSVGRKPLIEQLEGLLASQPGISGLSGLQLFVMQRDEVLVDEGFGWAAAGVPMTPETINLWMSSGKPLTAVAMMQLVEQGLVDLDDSVASILPSFAEHGKAGITIRHLLTHTGGFRSADIGWKPASWDAVLKRVCAVRPEPRWEPGEKAGYHVDGSWYVLGELVSRISGVPLPAYLAAKIFRPLGLTHTWLGIDGVTADAYGDGIAEVYDVSKDVPVMLEALNGPDALAVVRPGGNLRGPARDIGMFYRALLEGGAPVLAPETVQQMVSRQREGLFDESFKHVLDWGLGFIVNSNRYGADTVPYGYGRYASDATFGHSGRESSVGLADPENELVIAAVFNGMPGAVAHQQRMNSLLEMIYTHVVGVK